MSEVLSIKANDLYTQDRIKLRALKGSQSRLLCFHDNTGYLQLCKRIGKHPFMDLNRFYVYRLYKRIGIQYKSQTSSKMSVTHAPRHIAAIELLNSNDGLLFTSDYLRHKSKRTLQFYNT